MADLIINIKTEGDEQAKAKVDEVSKKGEKLEATFLRLGKQMAKAIKTGIYDVENLSGVIDKAAIAALRLGRGMTGIKAPGSAPFKAITQELNLAVIKALQLRSALAGIGGGGIGGGGAGGPGGGRFLPIYPQRKQIEYRPSAQVAATYLPGFEPVGAQHPMVSAAARTKIAWEDFNSTYKNFGTIYKSVTKEVIDTAKTVETAGLSAAANWDKGWKSTFSSMQKGAAQTSQRMQVIPDAISPKDQKKYIEDAERSAKSTMLAERRRAMLPEDKAWEATNTKFLNLTDQQSVATKKVTAATKERSVAEEKVTQAVSKGNIATQQGIAAAQQTIATEQKLTKEIGNKFKTVVESSNKELQSQKDKEIISRATETMRRRDIAGTKENIAVESRLAEQRIDDQRRTQAAVTQTADKTQKANQQWSKEQRAAIDKEKERMKIYRQAQKELGESQGFLNSRFGKFSIIMSGIAASLFVWQELLQFIRLVGKAITEVEDATARLDYELKGLATPTERRGMVTIIEEFRRRGVGNVKETTEQFVNLTNAGVSAADAMQIMTLRMEELEKAAGGTLTSNIKKLGGNIKTFLADYFKEAAQGIDHAVVATNKLLEVQNRVNQQKKEEGIFSKIFGTFTSIAKYGTILGAQLKYIEGILWVLKRFGIIQGEVKEATEDIAQNILTAESVVTKMGAEYEKNIPKYLQRAQAIIGGELRGTILKERIKDLLALTHAMEGAKIAEKDIEAVKIAVEFDIHQEQIAETLKVYQEFYNKLGIMTDEFYNNRARKIIQDFAEEQRKIINAKEILNLSPTEYLDRFTKPQAAPQEPMTIERALEIVRDATQKKIEEIDTTPVKTSMEKFTDIIDKAIDFISGKISDAGKKPEMQLDESQAWIRDAFKDILPYGAVPTKMAMPPPPKDPEMGISPIQADVSPIVNAIEKQIERQVPSPKITGAMAEITSAVDKFTLTITTGSERIDKAIAAASQQTGVDPRLIYSIMKAESNFRPEETSKAGAKGLMQIMPENFARLGLDANDPFNIEKNVLAGARHLQQSLQDFGGNIAAAIADYNTSPERVQAYLKTGKMSEFLPETQAYLPKVLGYLEQLGGAVQNATTTINAATQQFTYRPSSENLTIPQRAQERYAQLTTYVRGRADYQQADPLSKRKVESEMFAALQKDLKSTMNLYTQFYEITGDMSDKYYANELAKIEENYKNNAQIDEKMAKRIREREKLAITEEKILSDQTSLTKQQAKDLEDIFKKTDIALPKLIKYRQLSEGFQRQRIVAKTGSAQIGRILEIQDEIEDYESRMKPKVDFWERYFEETGKMTEEFYNYRKEMINKETRLMIEKGAEPLKAQEAENKRLLQLYKDSISEKVKSYETMYESTDRMSTYYYKNEIVRIEDERDRFIDVGVDKLIAYEWYLKEKKRLDIAYNLGLEDPSAGVRAAVDQAALETETMAQKTNETIRRITSETQSIMTDQLFDTMQLEFESVSDWFESLFLSFKSMIDRMVAEALAAQLARKLFGDLVPGGTGEGLVGGLLKKGVDLLTASSTPTGMTPEFVSSFTNIAGFKAKGGVFTSAGEITKFASGGIFDTPTLFPYAKGIGVLGEEGPEAIMPLTRGPGGKLGIESYGANKNVNISPTIVVQAPEGRIARQSMNQLSFKLGKTIMNSMRKNG